MVYPGATHSRFEHSLGAFHLAGKIAGALDVEPSDARLLKLAALLHDIGRGPFSHVAEPILKTHSDKEKLGDQIAESKVHELIGGMGEVYEADDKLGEAVSGRHSDIPTGISASRKKAKEKRILVTSLFTTQQLAVRATCRMLA